MCFVFSYFGFFFLKKNRVGGSGMDMRSKARVYVFHFNSTKNKTNCRKIDPHGERLGVWLYCVTDSLFCLPADSPWTCDRSIKAPKMELWWFKHWSSSWWRQWSDLIVRPLLKFLSLFQTHLLILFFAYQILK